MKKLTSLILVGLLAVTTLVKAQETPLPAPTPDLAMEAAAPISTNSVLGTIINDFKGATNFAVAPYGTYAPSAPTKVGFGIMGLYNLNQYVAGGVGIDWLGQFSMVSGNVQLQLPLYPLAHWGFPKLKVTPIVLGGIGKPMTGPNKGNVSTIADIGGYVSFGHWLGGVFNAGLVWGKWTGAGAYSGERYHITGAWSKGF